MEQSTANLCIDVTWCFVWGVITCELTTDPTVAFMIWPELQVSQGNVVNTGTVYSTQQDRPIVDCEWRAGDHCCIQTKHPYLNFVHFFRIQLLLIYPDDGWWHRCTVYPRATLCWLLSERLNFEPTGYIFHWFGVICDVVPYPIAFFVTVIVMLPVKHLGNFLPQQTDVGAAHRAYWLTGGS